MGLIFVHNTQIVADLLCRQQFWHHALIIFTYVRYFYMPS